MKEILIGILAVNSVAFVSLVARQLERIRPIEWNDQDIIADWKVTCTNLLLATLAKPVCGAFAAVIIVKAGGGLMHLRTDGWWYIVSLIALVIVNDLWHYWHHRLEHAVPVLWAMHSFHHSAKTVTFITGARHLWLETVITSAFLPLMPILFVVPPGMAMMVGCIYFLPDSCAHLNVRFSMGRAITWVNSPQWHRIHHSIHPEHHDKNFASLLPLWDILFGTAWIPQPNEYPATGIVSVENVDFVDGIVWPFRHYLRRARQIMLAILSLRPQTPVLGGTVSIAGPHTPPNGRLTGIGCLLYRRLSFTRGGRREDNDDHASTEAVDGGVGCHARQ